MSFLPLLNIYSDIHSLNSAVNIPVALHIGLLINGSLCFLREISIHFFIFFLVKQIHIFRKQLLRLWFFSLAARKKGKTQSQKRRRP